MSEFTDDVRRIVPGEADYLPPQPKQNKYLAQRDENLDEFEAVLREARDMVEEVLIGLEQYLAPQHKNLPLLLGQQIEQVIEFRRVRH